MKKSLIVGVSVIILIIIIIYNYLDDPRTKVLEKLNSSKTEELYFFEELPISFKRYNISEPLKTGSDTLFYEVWDRGPENLQSLIVFTQFSDIKEIDLGAHLINSNNSDVIEVKGGKGYYTIEESLTDSSSFLSEKITFVLEGVKYEIELLQNVKKEEGEIKAFGSEYIVNLINEYFIKN